MSCESCYCLCAPSWKCSRCLEKGWNDDTPKSEPSLTRNCRWCLLILWREHGAWSKATWSFLFFGLVVSNIFKYIHLIICYLIFLGSVVFLEEHPNTGFSMLISMDFPMKYGGFVYQKPCHPVIQSSRQGQGPSAWVGALDDRFETCGLRFSTYIYTYISHLKYRYHMRYDLCIYIYIYIITV